MWTSSQVFLGGGPVLVFLTYFNVNGKYLER